MNFDIKNNKYNFEITDLIELGKRTNNPKRNFLFISKLLGKHIIVRPDVVKASGVLLAALKYDNINPDNIVKYIKGEQLDISEDIMQVSNNTNKTLVIGFAETATGLGMAVASAVNNCVYQTTTREPINGLKNLLSFEEEHSHATTHQCFSMIDENFNNYDEIILVDDEITTGKTMINLIHEITKISTVKKFSILSVLDWRTKEYHDMYDEYLEKNPEISIDVYAVMSGNVSSDDTTVYTDSSEVEEIVLPADRVNDFKMMERVTLNTSYGDVDYYTKSGRFGVHQKDINELEIKIKEIAGGIGTSDTKTIVIGHGENIYIPSRVASAIGADFRTTTRSPIYCDGNIIKSKHSFTDRDVTYFLYNKEYIEKTYDRIILITETPLDIKLFDNIEIYNI